MMKRFVFAFVSMAAAGLMAAPNAALVPESADVVMTVDGLNVSDKEAEKVWQEELTKLGFEVPSTDPMKSLEEIAPGLSEPVAVLLGYSKESQTISATSLTAFIDLLPQVNKEKEPEGKLVLFLEQPKANLDALQKAMEDIDAGDLDLLITAPINKENVHGENFPYTGHTEFWRPSARVSL